MVWADFVVEFVKQIVHTRVWLRRFDVFVLQLPLEVQPGMIRLMGSLITMGCLLLQLLASHPVPVREVSELNCFVKN